MPPNGSAKTVAASSNETLCLARFAAAFCWSQSNSNTDSHYTCPYEDPGLGTGSPRVPIALGRGVAVRGHPPIGFATLPHLIHPVNLAGQVKAREVSRYAGWMAAIPAAAPSCFSLTMVSME